MAMIKIRVDDEVTLPFSGSSLWLGEYEDVFIQYDLLLGLDPFGWVDFGQAPYTKSIAPTQQQHNLLTTTLQQPRNTMAAAVSAALPPQKIRNVVAHQQHDLLMTTLQQPNIQSSMEAVYRRPPRNTDSEVGENAVIRITSAFTLMGQACL